MKFGSALTFYAKFPREMDKLLDIEQDDYIIFMPWLIDDKELNKIAGLIKTVGECCEREVQNFLGSCGEKIVSHFEQMCNLCSVNHRNNKWCITWRLWSKRVEKNHNVYIGINIDTIHQNLVAYPWVWLKGGRSQESKLKEIFGGNVQTAKETGWSPGGIRFTGIPFLVSSDQTDIEADIFLEQIVSPFLSITDKQLNKLFDLVK